MREIGAFEAKTKLSTLLDWVERGEEVVITRRGKAVARMIPATPGIDRERARAAAQRIRERAEKLKLGRFDWAEWKAYRDEGRL
ncbi:MAG: type II toxin-antitoxin system prevent-host-death family antitoxin [Candidatus Binataceae bacterium]